MFSAEQYEERRTTPPSNLGQHTLKVFPCSRDIRNYVGDITKDGSEDHYSS